MPSRVYPSHFAASFGDEGGETYPPFHPSSVLPGHDAVNSIPPYGSQDISSRWTPVVDSHRASSGLFVEHDPAYGNSHIPFLPSSGGRVSSLNTDGSAIFPGMTSLATSLPPTSPTCDRILPRPNQTQGGASSLNGLAESSQLASSGPSQGLNSKPLQQAWLSETAASSASRESRRDSSRSSTMTDRDPKHSLSSPPKEASSSYRLTSDSPRVNMETESRAYGSISLASPITPQSNYATSDPPPPPSRTSHTLLSNDNPSSDLYSFSAGSSYKRGSFGESSDAGEGKLVSGQPYTQLRHPQPQATPSVEAIRHSSFEARPYTAHRTSISSYRA
ncbi:MAG: hypothetical protein M1833_005604 [Piccolia ochrophora]|nr:MAG: hypothetical protein M1833_005604 [Piccolia ochrophora]